MRTDNSIKILIIFIVATLVTAVGCESLYRSRPESRQLFGLQVRAMDQGLRPVIRQGDASEKVVALTFDDGPDPRFTPRIIDILKKESVIATFFMIGESVRDYPQIVRKAAMHGNLIENHSWDHPMCQHLTYGELKWQLDETSKEIARVTGRTPIFFRPPRGALSPKIHKASARSNLKIVLWTDSVKASVAKSPLDEAYDIGSRATDGSIILLHDGLLDREKDVRALPHLIKHLKNRGFRFVGLDYFLKDKQKRQEKPLLTAL